MGRFSGTHTLVSDEDSRSWDKTGYEYKAGERPDSLGAAPLLVGDGRSASSMLANWPYLVLLPRRSASIFSSNADSALAIPFTEICLSSSAV